MFRGRDARSNRDAPRRATTPTSVRARGRRENDARDEDAGATVRDDDAALARDGSARDGRDGRAMDAGDG